MKAPKGHGPAMHKGHGPANHKAQRPQLGALYAAAAALVGTAARGGVLPDDRADLLYHSYSGGGVTINGTSLLVRKKVGDHVSLVGNWYTDSVSGASIDVVTQASPYKEKRNQGSLGVDLLLGKVTYRAGYINGSEPDFRSRTAYASVSEDLFGDLTTITFGASRGWDKIGERGAPDFKASADRRNWSVGLSQVLTRNLLASLDVETSESEGYLQNPYRQARYLSGDPRGYSYEKEAYPHTRTGNAFSARAKYYLRWRAALDGNYRYYRDTWGIVAHTAELGYTLPAFHRWVFDAHARYYRQTQANFYSDLFPYADSQNFMARDRELAAFKELGLGFGASWEWRPRRHVFLQKGTVNLRYDNLRFKYDDFRDLRVQGVAAGTEPLYTLKANVLQLYVSAWF
jgi:hypothetical protein